MIRLWGDRVVAHFAKYNVQSLIRWQKTLRHWVMWQGNVPNSADFMASYKIYTVFHLSGCFKFKATFQNIFLFLILILIWNLIFWFCGISKPKKATIIAGTEHVTLDLVINHVKGPVLAIMLLVPLLLLPPLPSKLTSNYERSFSQNLQYKLFSLTDSGKLVH